MNEEQKNIASVESGGHSESNVAVGSSSDTAFILSGLNLGLVMLGLGLGVFLMAIDTSILATAIPSITSHFGSTADIGWYGSAYSFALCALQPIAGKLYASFSHKIIFLVFFGIFEIGSLICGVAVNSNMLIVGRAIAGLGGAGIATGALSIIAASLPLRKRPIFLAGLQSVFGVATIVGPLIGGALTEHVSWRWCFYINLPVGALTFITLIVFFRPPSRNVGLGSVQQKLAKLDMIGAFLFIPSVIMVLLALQWGGSTYPWKSATIIGLFCGFAGLAILFILWQIRKGDDAMIPPRLIKQRTLFAASLAVFFTMGGIFTVVYYLPEWFQVAKGASPTKSGVMYLPSALAEILAANLSGLLVMQLGYYNPFLLLGTTLMAIGSGLFTTFKPDTGHFQWISYQVLQGLGAGMNIVMPFIAIQAVLKPEDIPIGNSIVLLFQFFGGSVFLAISQAVFSNRLLDSLAKLGDIGIDEIDIQRIIHAGATAIRTAVTEAQLPAVIKSFNIGITSTFYVAAGACAGAFVAAAFLEWKSVKGKSLMPA